MNDYAEKLYQKGKDYYNSNKKIAFKLFLQAAELGHMNAMNRVAYAYLYQNQGVDCDIDKCAFWTKKSS